MKGELIMLKELIKLLSFILIMTLVVTGCGVDKKTNETTKRPEQDIPKATNDANVVKKTNETTKQPEQGNPRTTNDSNQVNSVENLSIISIEEAKKVAEEFCRKPNIGVQAFHDVKRDIVINNEKYYYFDMIYGLLMDDKSKAEDNVISELFVKSTDKSLYKAVEQSSDNITEYNLGNKLK